MYLRSLEINTAYEWDLEYGGGNPVYLETDVKVFNYAVKYLF